ncbi:glycosyltransferase family 1 protein, partial [Micromonospora azadirachtae]
MGVDPRRGGGHQKRCRFARGRRQLRGGRMSADAEVIDLQQPARHQRVLMLSWEYPPVLVGGLGRHV